MANVNLCFLHANYLRASEYMTKFTKTAPARSAPEICKYLHSSVKTEFAQSMWRQNFLVVISIVSIYLDYDGGKLT